MSESSRSSLSPLSIISEQNLLNDVVSIQVYIPCLAIQKRLEVNLNDTVWSVKENLLAELAQSIPDALNYGLFLPPCNGRAGKFLLEDRIFRDYPFQDCPAYLELKYKKRVYKSFNVDVKTYKRLHSKPGLKRFVELVERRDAKRIEAMCQLGLDPNFHNAHGDTPLTLAASMDNNRDVIMALVSGGAHLDFRNIKSETALHLSAFNASSANCKLLLDLGASAQCKDCRGLTPLFYSCSKTQNNPDVAEMLLRDFADTAQTDAQGNTEMHQACKNGLVGHLEHLLFYGADMDLQNHAGNTPLHICVINNQVACAKVLLFRNANASLYNKSGQMPYHIAIRLGSKEFMQLFTLHDPQKTVPYRSHPRYNSKRRLTLSRAFLTKNSRRSISIFDQYSVSEYGTISRAVGRKSSSTTTTTNNDCCFFTPQNRSCSVSSPKNSENGGEKRSLLYEAIERMRNGGSKDNIDEENEEETCDEVVEVSETPAEQTYNRRYSQPIDFHQVNHCGTFGPGQSTMTLPAKKTIKEDCKRIIVIPRATNGFGFVLRGAKKMSVDSCFEPSDDVPSLQFFDSIDSSGMAAKAGLKAGDFLLEVNGVDVRRWNHSEVVQLISACTEIITIKVVTVESCENNQCDFTESAPPCGAPEEPLRIPRIYETRTLPNKRTSLASLTGCSAFSLYDTAKLRCKPDATLPASYRDPRCKVASVKSRAAGTRRISAAELEILMSAQQNSPTLDNKNETSRNDTAASTTLNPLSSPSLSSLCLSNTANSCNFNNQKSSTSSPPKVYASVAEMKRSSAAPQAKQQQQGGCPKTCAATRLLSDSSAVNDDDGDQTIVDSSNSTPIRARKPSLRPKTPPPPPPAPKPKVDVRSRSNNIDVKIDGAEKARSKSVSAALAGDSYSTVADIINNYQPAEQQTFLSPPSKSPSLLSNDADVGVKGRPSKNVTPSTGDFATDLRNALARRRRQMGASEQEQHEQRRQLCVDTGVEEKMTLPAGGVVGVARSENEASSNVAILQSAPNLNCDQQQQGGNSVVVVDVAAKSPSLSPSSCSSDESTTASTSTTTVTGLASNNSSKKQHDSGYASSQNSLAKSECSGESINNATNAATVDTPCDTGGCNNSSTKESERKHDQPPKVGDRQGQVEFGGDEKALANSKLSSTSSFSKKPVNQWTVADVGAWLDSLHLSEYRYNFEQSSVDGGQLAKFGRADFARMGLTRIAHRLTIENALKSHRSFDTNCH